MFRCRVFCLCQSNLFSVDRIDGPNRYSVHTFQNITTNCKPDTCLRALMCLHRTGNASQGANDSAFQPDDFGIEYRPVRTPSTFIAGGSNGGGKRISTSGLVAGSTVRVKPDE